MPAPYDPTGFADEALLPGGAPRPGSEALLRELAGADLSALWEGLNRTLEDAGVRFGRAPFRVDPMPRVLEAHEWARLSRGIAQRVLALEAFTADVYGERQVVKAGAMPTRVIESADHFEPWMMGVEVSSYTPVAGLDVVRGGDQVLRVLEDNLRTPSGLVYATESRAATDAVLPLAPPPERQDQEVAFAALGEAVRATARTGDGDPSVVLLSDGPANSAFHEHRQLADRLAVPLVTPGDIYVRGGRLKALVGGRRPRDVDVVYRRTDEDRLREPSGRGTWLADALLGPVRRGRLAVANAFGAGVADDKLVHAYVDDMVRFYLGEDPLLPSVPTFDLGDPTQRKEALRRLDELVVKPRSGHGGRGIVVCPHASAEDREAVARRVRERPEAWVAQELVELSRHPTVVDGRLQPRHVDLRAFAIGGRAVPAALTRVAFGAGALVVNSSQNGGGKDTWVLA